MLHLRDTRVLQQRRELLLRLPDQHRRELLLRLQGQQRRELLLVLEDQRRRKLQLRQAGRAMRLTIAQSNCALLKKLDITLL
jgi:hypothetical protein